MAATKKLPAIAIAAKYEADAPPPVPLPPPPPPPGAASVWPHGHTSAAHVDVLAEASKLGRSV
ncbi:hypothetical protein AAVH_30574 [Aphelenchoides avenae]|nr:hypothetical protein AAVH_30574 [Aphelenchus avenae]